MFAKDLADHLQTLFDSEKGTPLFRIRGNGNDDPVKDTKGALNEVDVSVGDGIE